MEKYVLITGASRGIGRMCAEVFARNGIGIYALARNKDHGLEALKSELTNKYGVFTEIFSGDAADESFILKVFREVKNTGLDYLVNNAGIDYMGLLQDMTYADWKRIFETNVSSGFLTCKYAIPLFLAKEEGSIVNVSSVWGQHGASFETAYSATKGAVDSFTKALARELGPSHIKVNAASFGVIDTAMNDCLSEEDKKNLADEIPMGRFGSASEAAELIYDLAVNHPYMTGQIVTLDGGWT